MNPKHQKVTTYKKTEDGIEIDSKSYYESLAHQVTEIEKQLMSSFFTLKKDVEATLDHVLEDGSPKLVLTIETKNGNPRITKRYVTTKQTFPRR